MKAVVDEWKDVMEPGFYNMDCMEAMREFPDGFFDLAIVDPPYGDGGKNIGEGYGSEADLTGTKKVSRTGGTWATKYGKKILAWDVAPKDDYFKELFRVSRNQIIWGGNYFSLPPARCFVVWDKTIPENFTMAMCEYAWTSIDGNAKIFRKPPNGPANGEQRIHACQKPISLYTWLLSKYAKPGMKILDTHVGSASSLIACHRAGFEYWGFEIDPVYYKAAKERLDRETAQVSIIDVLS